MRVAIFLLICVWAFGSEYVRFMMPKEYKGILLQKPLKKVRVGEKSLVKVLPVDAKRIVVYAKKAGRTPLFLEYSDGSFDTYTLYILPNIQTLKKIVRVIEPNLELSMTKRGVLLIDGRYSSLSKKHQVEEILQKFGFDKNATVDLAGMKNYRRMVRAKLYAIEIDENRAKKLKTDLSLFHIGDSRSFFAKILSSSPTVAGSLLSGGYQKFDGRLQLNSLITFLQDKGIAHVIDDTMLTIKEENNGTIFIGGEVYIPSQISYDANGRPTIGTEPKKYGLTLTITPKINDQNVIDMDIDLKSSDFDANPAHKVFIGADLQGNPIYIPAFITKEDSTSLLVHNKEIIALGGKLSKLSSYYQEKVPFLGDIPIVGNLFKNRSRSYQQRDILFFIVPEVVTVQNEDRKKFQTVAQKFPKDFSLGRIYPVRERKNSATISNISSKIEVESKNFLKKEDSSKPKHIKKLYKVAVSRCFIRSLKDNSIVDVWKQDHPFVGERIGHSLKVKILKNCTNTQECEQVNKAAYISLKCIKED